MTTRRCCIIRNLLKQLGFSNIDEASDGSAALNQLRTAEKTCSLVISDWNMEPMTGLRLLREVRADAKLKATPFIMVTANQSRKRYCCERGWGIDYIVKPFNAETLKAKMVSVLGDFKLFCRFTVPMPDKTRGRGHGHDGPSSPDSSETQGGSLHRVAERLSDLKRLAGMAVSVEGIRKVVADILDTLSGGCRLMICVFQEVAQLASYIREAKAEVAALNR